MGALGYHAGASVKMGKLFIGNAERTDWKVRGLYVAVQGVCAALSGMADKQQAVGMFESPATASWGVIRRMRSFSGLPRCSPMYSV